MTDTKHPEALRLAALYDADAWPGGLSLNAWAAASAAELRRLHAENTTLQQGYDAARMEIDHLRGATKMVEPAQPVAWLVYLPSIDTQNVYDSQDDPGYVDDVTNHDDAVVTPLYQMAVPAGHALVPVTGITATPTTQAAPKSAPVARPSEDAVNRASLNLARKHAVYLSRESVRELLAEAAPVAQGDALDAARYRWLRSCNLAKHPAVRDGFELGDAHLDAAIDAAKGESNG